MTEQLITEIQRKMLPYLNNEQLMHLRDAMAETLEGATITYDSGSIPADETDAVEAFITAKRIEGCSEKTLSYYRKTIEALIAGVGKAVRQITTDDLRRYLTSYQVQRRSSKVTISEYDSENLMYSVIQEVLSEEAFSSIGCAVHLSLATLVKNYEPLTEEERKYARNPLTHVDFLLFNQMDKQPMLAIEVDGTGFHEAGSKQAERDIKKNSILEKCAVPLLRLRTDGSGEKEKIKNALKRE